MFIPSVEQWLMIGIVLLYLYDSTILIYCNEGFLIPVSKGNWKVVFGSSRFHVFGKEIFIPNPFTFYRPLFKMSWRFEGASSKKIWYPPDYPFYRLTPWLWLIALSLFVLFPLGIFRVYPERVLMLALIFLYFGILMALYRLWRARHVFALSNRRFLHLAFESLICPPFALNLTRHVSVGLVIDADLLESARHLQNPAGWSKSCAGFIPRIEEEISHEQGEDENARTLAMQSLVKQLREQECHGHQ